MVSVSAVSSVSIAIKTVPSALSACALQHEPKEKPLLYGNRPVLGVPGRLYGQLGVLQPRRGGFVRARARRAAGVLGDRDHGAPGQEHHGGAGVRAVRDTQAGQRPDQSPKDGAPRENRRDRAAQSQAGVDGERREGV